MKPSTELTVEVVQPDGSRYRWDSNGTAENRPQGISFRTRRGEGFADASVDLSRRIDGEYSDLNLYDSVNFIGADGSVAYEGRVGAMPRSLGDTHSVSLSLAGWMSHARDRKFTEVYVDRDLGSWRGPSAANRASIYTGSATVGDAPSVVPDVSTGSPALTLGFHGAWTTTQGWRSVAIYDAGPDCKVASVYYDISRSGNSPMGTASPWLLNVYPASSDNGSVGTGVNLVAASTGYATLTSPQRFAYLEAGFNSGSAGGSSGDVRETLFRRLAVYGNHGLARRGSDPGGFSASDIIKDVAARFCPRLNTGAVTTTNYTIPHVVFREPTDPYDAFLDVNKYHLWDIAVWENRCLTYGPYDLTDYDWEVRTTDPGVGVDLQGDSTEALANGIVVTYQDVAKGAQNRLLPTSWGELRDDGVENPANRAGLQVWTEITLSAPTTQDAALQIGRAALAEYNQPRAAGSITVRGHIRDRAGHWHPVWKVRAGDTVAITNHPNDRPRLITETAYNHPDGGSGSGGAGGGGTPPTLTISTDSTAKRLDALLDRLGTAISIGTLAP